MRVDAVRGVGGDRKSGQSDLGARAVLEEVT